MFIYYQIFYYTIMDSVHDYIKKALIIKDELDNYLNFKIELNGSVKYNKSYSLDASNVNYEPAKKNLFTVKDEKTGKTYKFENGKIVFDSLILDFYKKYGINNVKIGEYLTKKNKHDILLEYSLNNINFYIERNIIYLYSDNHDDYLIGLYMIPYDKFFDSKSLKYGDYQLKFDYGEFEFINSTSRFNFGIDIDIDSYIAFNMRLLFDEYSEVIFDEYLFDNCINNDNNDIVDDCVIVIDEKKQLDKILNLLGSFVDKKNGLNKNRYDKINNMMITESGYKIKISKEIFDSIKNLSEEEILGMYSNSNKKARV